LVTVQVVSAGVQGAAWTGADLTGGHLCSGRLGPRPVTSWAPGTG